MFRIQSLTAEYFKLPLKNPFVLSIRSATYANVIRWQLKMDDGAIFLGESVPVQYVTGETPDSVLATVPKLEGLLYGCAVEDLWALITEMSRQFPADVAARAGVEIALYSALANQMDIPVYKLLGGQHDVVETDLTIARIPNALEVAEEASRQGFRILKMKVGGGAMEEDIDRIGGIAAVLPNAVFRLDANQSLTVEETMKLAYTLLENGIQLELIEQPVPKEDITALDEISRISPVPIIADEACCNAQDAFRLFAETAVQGVNVKLMKSGIVGALDIIRVAKAAGKKLMIGCMLESEIGMAAGVALACGTGAFDYVDLDGHLLLDMAEPITLFHAHGPKLEIVETKQGEEIPT
jgi:L-alanine-DL-glutamate epimerase-like enolase superfamily enzyme